MNPSGVITITTDFGHKGPFAAVMKGVILTRFPAARVIDLAHDIPAQWPPEAGFWVSRAFRFFPPGTVHLAIVDPGVGTERDILVAEHAGHVFMAPDNGLLAQLLENAADARVYRLDTARMHDLQLPAASATSSAPAARARSRPSAARARPDSHAGRASAGLSVVGAGRVVTRIRSGSCRHSGRVVEKASTAEGRRRDGCLVSSPPCGRIPDNAKHYGCR